MLTDALVFLIKTVFGLFTMALLLRFYIQWARAAHRNPLSEFLYALTDFIVKPARRLVPGFWGLDFARWSWPGSCSLWSSRWCCKWPGRRSVSRQAPWWPGWRCCPS
jgi:YggT family protein